jgi:hypothetical protein
MFVDQPYYLSMLTWGEKSHMTTCYSSNLMCFLKVDLSLKSNFVLLVCITWHCIMKACLWHIHVLCHLYNGFIFLPKHKMIVKFWREVFLRTCSCTFKFLVKFKCEYKDENNGGNVDTFLICNILVVQGHVKALGRGLGWVKSESIIHMDWHKLNDKSIYT